MALDAIQRIARRYVAVVALAIALVLGSATVAVCAENPYALDGRFSSPGMYAVHGIDAAPDGSVVVVDRWRGLSRFDGRTGALIREWDHAWNITYGFVQGTRNRYYSYGLEVAPDGLVYSAVKIPGYIEVFDTEGVSQSMMWISPAHLIAGLDLASDGYLYVMDRGGACVSKLTKDGSVVQQFPMPNGIYGRAYYCGVAVNSKGEVYASDGYRGLIEVFSPDGTWLRSVQWPGAGVIDGYGIQHQGQMAFDKDDNLFVATGVRGVLVYDSSDQLAYTITAGAGQASDVTIAGDGYLYVSDYNGAVARYRPADSQAPVTAIELEGTEGANGWHRSEVKVTLSATDDRSGVDRTEYSLDGGATWISYSNPIEIGTQGVTEITYRSIDRVGNVEQNRFQRVLIDSIAPSVTISSPSGEYLIGDSVTVAWVAEDGGSGVASVDAFAPAGSRLTVTAGEHSGTVTVADEAGNVATASTSWRASKRVKLDPVKGKRAGSTVQIRLNVDDEYGAPVRDLDISVDYSLDGGASFQPALGPNRSGITVDEHAPGAYKAEWGTPATSGTYLLRFSVNGVVFYETVQLTL